MTPISEYLLSRRVEMRMSIQQLSDACGISPSHISRLERGIRNPSPKTLEKLAIPLDVGYLKLLQIAGLVDHPESGFFRLDHILNHYHCLYKDKPVSPSVLKKIIELLESPH